MNVHAGGVAPAQEQTVDLRPAIDKMGTWAQGTRMAVLKALAAGKQDHEIKKECNLNIDVQDYLERKIFNEFGFPEELGHMRRKHAIDAYRAFLARPEPVARPFHAIAHGEPAVPQPAVETQKPNSLAEPLLVLEPTDARAPSTTHRKRFAPEALAKGAVRISRLTDLERKVLQALVKHERVSRMSDALGMSMNAVTANLNAIYLKLGLRALDGSFEVLETNRDFAIQAYELVLKHPELATQESLIPPDEKKDAATASKPAAQEGAKTPPARLTEAQLQEAVPAVARRLPELTVRLCRLVLAYVDYHGNRERVANEIGVQTASVHITVRDTLVTLGIGPTVMNADDSYTVLKRAVGQVRAELVAKVQGSKDPGHQAETTVAPEATTRPPREGVDEVRAQAIAARVGELTPAQQRALFAAVDYKDLESAAATLGITRGGIIQRLKGVFGAFQIGKGMMGINERAALLKKAVEFYRAMPETEREVPPKKSRALSAPYAPPRSKAKVGKVDEDALARVLERLPSLLPVRRQALLALGQYGETDAAAESLGIRKRLVVERLSDAYRDLNIGRKVMGEKDRLALVRRVFEESQESPQKLAEEESPDIQQEEAATEAPTEPLAVPPLPSQVSEPKDTAHSRVDPVEKKSPKRSASSAVVDNTELHAIDVHIGERLRERRKLLKLSQQALAGAVGVSFQQIQKYERGANRISGSVLWALSQVLRIDVRYFYEGLPGVGYYADEDLEMRRGKLRDARDAAVELARELIERLEKAPI